MKLYNTEKELFYEDYVAIPDLCELNCTEIAGLIENLYNAFDNAFVYGSDLLQTALYDDIAKVNKKRCFDYILQTSPGHIAAVIGSDKYREIDKACSVAWRYFNEQEEEFFFNIGIDPGNIEKEFKKAYTNSER